MGGMIVCTRCGEILHSTYRHDFQQCHCDNHTHVDGGNDYMKIGGGELVLIQSIPHDHFEDGNVVIDYKHLNHEYKKEKINIDWPIEYTIIQKMQELLYGSKKPTVPEVLPIAKWFYELPNNGAGGSLHIVLDDYNIDDGSVISCIDWARKNKDYVGLILARILLRMSKTQRKKIASNI